MSRLKKDGVKIFDRDNFNYHLFSNVCMCLLIFNKFHGHENRVFFLLNVELSKILGYSISRHIGLIFVYYDIHKPSSSSFTHESFPNFPSVFHLTHT